MDRRKTISAALFITLLGAMVFLPPLIHLAPGDALLFGVPAELVYVFTAWIALVLAAWWLGRRLPHDESNGGDG